MGARERYRSCPAVSQISNFTVASSRATVWVRKAAVLFLTAAARRGRGGARKERRDRS
jgi:hypothetical protein